MEIKAAQKILKDIKFPGGKDIKHTAVFARRDDGSIDRERVIGLQRTAWDRKGGHGGMKTQVKTVVAALALGFVNEATGNTSVPDGSRVNGHTTYVHPETGVALKVYTSYGATAADNWFSLDVFFPTPEAEAKK